MKARSTFFRKNRFITPIVFLLIIGIHHLWAQSPEDQWSGFYDTRQLSHIRQVTVPMIGQDFRQLMWPKLTASEQKKIGSVTLSFPQEDGKSLMNFYAQRNPKTIVLPQSALRFLSDLSLAYAYTNRRGISQVSLSTYMSILRYQWPQIKNKRYRPLEALGIDKNKALADKNTEDLFGKIYSTAIWFIIGHELGHLYHGHSGYEHISAEQARIQEAMADDFALRFLERVGDPPYGGILVFFWISQHFTPFPADNAAYRNKATHPLVANRLWKVAKHLHQNAARYARLQTSPQQFTKLYEASADEIRLIGDHFASGKLWELVRAQGQNGDITRLNVHQHYPAPEGAESSVNSFAGSYTGYWRSVVNKNRVIPVQLKLYVRQGQIRGEGLITDGEGSGNSADIPWQLTRGEIENDSLYFDWLMSNGYFGKGAFKLIKSGIKGKWWTIQGLKMQNAGELEFKRKL